MPAGSKVKCGAKHSETPSVRRVSQFFFQAKFCLAKNHCIILKLLTILPVSKKETGLFFDGIRMHIADKTQELVALKNIIVLLKKLVCQLRDRM